MSVARHGRRLATALLLALAVALLPGAAVGEPDAARGAYLAAAAGCDQCHTDAKNGGQPYAGGRAIQTQYGTVYTPNITPDRASGIGGWQRADFARAVRWGIAPDDSHYLPAFPFAFYNRLSDRDLDDLRAFLATVPSTSRAVAPGNISILSAARARAALAVLDQRFPGTWIADPAKGAVWNRGAYLVASVGRCGDCHTPRNFFAAPNPERALSGSSTVLGGKAPNITPDPETGIGSWSEDDIVTLLKDGQTPEFDFIGGAMAEIVRNTARLDDADRRAIAAYLKSVPSIRSQKKGQ